MAVFRRFEDVDAWQKGRELVKRVYALTRSGSLASDYGLKDQIQRAAVSVCSNIAEGFARRGNRELVNFLWIFRGSAAEVCSQLYNIQDLHYATPDQCKEVYDLAAVISSELFSLIRSLMPNIEHQKLRESEA